MKLLDALTVFILTGAYAGKSPKAPGTAGTVVAALLATILVNSNQQLLWAGIATILGVWLTNIALKRELFGQGNNKDPQQIVLDEIAGYFVTLVGVTLSPATIVAAFFLFRLFDITKPFPIKKIETLPTGWGIVMDDIMAGVYANITLHLLIYLIS